MSRFIMQVEAKAQITQGTTGQTIAAALGISTDDDCLIDEVVIQADSTNSGVIYVGGVDASGVSDVSSTKCISLTADKGVTINADVNPGDEDRAVFDLREISLRASTAGQKVNVMVVRLSDVKYTA